MYNSDSALDKALYHEWRAQEHNLKLGLDLYDWSRKDVDDRLFHTMQAQYWMHQYLASEEYLDEGSKHIVARRIELSKEFSGENHLYGG